MSEIIAKNLINLSCKSDIDDEFDEFLILYLLSTREKLRKSNFLKKKKKRKSHGEFHMSSDFFVIKSSFAIFPHNSFLIFIFMQST